MVGTEPDSYVSSIGWRLAWKAPRAVDWAHAHRHARAVNPGLSHNGHTEMSAGTGHTVGNATPLRAQTRQPTRVVRSLGFSCLGDLRRSR
jgi:hypothetical protein